MNTVAQLVKQRGVRLLEAHLESFDPEATQARERLDLELGNELAHKLIFALAARPPDRRAA
jgi:hypothetical protein